MNGGFLKLQRSREAFELLKDPHAFVLLTIIALRARRTTEFNIHGLGLRQALIGDFANYGLTERQYRTAKRRLTRWGLAVFKGTPRGTIATLCDTRIYDINEAPAQPPDNHQATTWQPPDDEQATDRRRLTIKERMERMRRI